MPVTCPSELTVAAEEVPSPQLIVAELLPTWPTTQVDAIPSTGWNSS